MATNGKLTPAQQRAIAALLQERDTRAAAVAARVAERTLHRWMHEDEKFKRALQVTQAELINTMLRRLTHSCQRAIDTLDTAMQTADKDSVKVTAANYVLSRLLNIKELVELEGRVAMLEEQLNAQSAR